MSEEAGAEVVALGIIHLANVARRYARVAQLEARERLAPTVMQRLGMRAHGLVGHGGADGRGGDDPAGRLALVPLVDDSHDQPAGEGAAGLGSNLVAQLGMQGGRVRRVDIPGRA